MGVNEIRNDNVATMGKQYHHCESMVPAESCKQKIVDDNNDDGNAWTWKSFQAFIFL